MEEMNQSTPTPTASKSKNMLPVIGLVGALFVIALVGGVWYSNQSTSTTNTQKQSPVESPSYPGQAVDDEAEQKISQTIEIEAGSFYYKPSEIKVKKGETIRLILNSKDMMHDFNIDELNLTIPVTKSGNTNTVTFTADTAGEFEFYCSVGSHRAQGQVGTLIVE